MLRWPSNTLDNSSKVNSTLDTQSAASQVHLDGTALCLRKEGGADGNVEGEAVDEPADRLAERAQGVCHVEGGITRGNGNGRDNRHKEEDEGTVAHGEICLYEEGEVVETLLEVWVRSEWRRIER